MPSAEEIAKHPRRSERADDSKSGPAAKRRKIEADPVLPVRENPKEKALAITEEFIVQRLTTKGAADLVIEALVRIFDLKLYSTIYKAFFLGCLFITIFLPFRLY